MKKSKVVKSKKAKRVVKPRGPSKLELAQLAKRDRDAHFAAAIAALQRNVTDMQLRTEASSSINSALDELLALYNAK